MRSAREVLVLVDRVAGYRAARGGRAPAAVLRAVCRRWEFVIKEWAGDPAAGSKMPRADGGDAFPADLAEAAADVGWMADGAAALARRLADLSATLKAWADAGPD